MQIRVKAGTKEERISLSDRFVKAVTEVASATLIKERKLSDYGVRYGELPDIAREVEQELEAAYPPERLEQVIQQAIAHGTNTEEFVEHRRALAGPELEEALQSEDWNVRYAALDGMEPTEERLHLVAQALRDSKMQIRRLAVVYLGTFVHQKQWNFCTKRFGTALPLYGVLPGIHCQTSATLLPHRP